MLWILEPQAISNFTDRKTGIENTVFRYSDQLSLYILLCRISGLFFNQVTKIIRRQMQGIGTILNRRKPPPFHSRKGHGDVRRRVRLPGGGGSTSDLPWGRRKDEDEREWARRCAREAERMIGRKPKVGQKR